MNLLTQEVINQAKKWIGHKETAPNDSTQIREWLKRCGINKPVPWCSAFAWSMVDDASSRVLVANPVTPYAGGRNLLSKAKELGFWTNEPVPGAVFGIGHPNGKSHVGIVVSVGAFSVVTIEGNTNEAGSREGNCVRQRSREIADIDLGYWDPGMMIK
jgi:hypothetical protein